MDFKTQFKAYVKRIERGIETLMPTNHEGPKKLYQAIHYSMNASGKRLRPCLTLAAFEIFPSEHDPLAAAVAIECLHTSSLIHDDLPCMDDSDLRRGRTACHKQFDEATALLAGSALLPIHLKLLSHYREDAQLHARLVTEYTNSILQVIEGQVQDLASEKQASVSEDDLKKIHKNKTACLIATSLVVGMLIGDGPEESVEKMRAAGMHLGLAFQIIDDILDVTSSSETLGKPVGADATHQKASYPALFGVENSRKKAIWHNEQCIELLKAIGGANTFCIELAEYMKNRDY